MRNIRAIGFFMIFLGIFGCSSVPEWTQTGLSKDPFGGSSLSAVGTGPTLDAAKKSAISELAQLLLSRVAYRYDSEVSAGMAHPSRTTRQSISVFSSEELSGVIYPKTYYESGTWYALATVKKMTLIQQIFFRRKRLQREISIARNTLAHEEALDQIKTLRRMVQKERSIDSFSLVLDGLGQKTSPVESEGDALLLQSLSRKYLTFFVDPAFSHSILSFVVDSLTMDGFSRVGSASHATFVLQGGLHSAPAFPPDNRSYFWRSFSIVLSLSKMSDGRNLVIKSMTGLVPGETGTLAKINETNYVLLNVVKPFSSSVKEKIFGR